MTRRCYHKTTPNRCYAIIKEKRKTPGGEEEHLAARSLSSGQKFSLSVVSLWSGWKWGRNSRLTVKNHAKTHLLRKVRNSHDSEEIFRLSQKINNRGEVLFLHLSPVNWSEWRDLNPRPHGPEPCALPTALHPDSYIIIIFIALNVKR